MDTLAHATCYASDRATDLASRAKDRVGGLASSVFRTSSGASVGGLIEGGTASVSSIGKSLGEKWSHFRRKDAGEASESPEMLTESYFTKNENWFEELKHESAMPVNDAYADTNLFRSGSMSHKGSCDGRGLSKSRGDGGSCGSHFGGGRGFCQSPTSFFKTAEKRKQSDSDDFWDLLNNPKAGGA